MGTYYIDIETTGLDPLNNEIITVQYLELERGTGIPVGEVQILKAWGDRRARRPEDSHRGHTNNGQVRVLIHIRGVQFEV